MSLFQNLLETYEKCKDTTGIQRMDDGEPDEKKTFLPIFHTTFKSQICIKLDDEGRFITATRDNKDITIIIPCTDRSAGRSSGVAAHPLCDQIDYVCKINDTRIAENIVDPKKKDSKNKALSELLQVNCSKTSDYLKSLKKWKEWAEGIPKMKLAAIYTYVRNGSMFFDLMERQIFKESEYDNQDGTKLLDYERVQKIGVRFAIEVKDDLDENVWEDKALRECWIDYIRPERGNQQVFDYLCGAQVGKIASQHPKNINSMTGNAKLLSCNDSNGYTFRGRFSEQNEAVIVDYEQSQKMHQTLRWLINNYGYNTDSQTIITWAVDMDSKPPAEPYRSTFGLLSEIEAGKRDSEKLRDAVAAIGSNYAKKLKNLFQGNGKASGIKPHHRKICIAAFDAATTGRMGLTFYQELFQDDYLENIIKWHEETSYYLTAWKKESDEKGKEKSIPKQYIGAPSYDDILFAIYGRARGGNDAGYNTLKRKVRKQLLECMFGNFTFPKSMVEMAARRASQPMLFMDSNGKFNPNDWERGVSITCALMRKYYKQQKKEEITVALDKTRKDRDYLYGRLLAIADRLEDYAMYKLEKRNERPTNAIKHMAAFAIKPYHTWGVLYKQLIPYISQLNGAEYFQNMIDEVLDLFEQGYEDNESLSPLYLLGYSAQRRELINKSKKNNTEGNENGNSEQI